MGRTNQKFTKSIAEVAIVKSKKYLIGEVWKDERGPQSFTQKDIKLVKHVHNDKLNIYESIFIQKHKHYFLNSDLANSYISFVWLNLIFCN